MKYEAIIFDMDGTIVATNDIWHRVDLEILKKRSIPFTPELKRELETRLLGLAMYESCIILKELTGIIEDTQILIREKQQLADALYHEGVSYMPGFEDFHQKLKKLNIPTAIATNATEKTLQKTDKKLNLKKHFGEHLYSIAHVNNVCKPDPAIYLFAAQQLSADPKKCLVFEDSAHGVAAAKAAGMTCIGINSAGNKKYTERADMIIDHFHELDVNKILF
jgi:HAD superfamily hydrolase (TIGR01509 family)